VENVDCIVVGAGLSGLACAQTLLHASKSVLVLEASDTPGGRVATDTVDGFRVDRGFQVYLDSYAEGQRFLDYASLTFGAFEPGALVAHRGRLFPVSDPWRRPIAAIRSVLSGAVGVSDGLRIAWLRSQVLAGVRRGEINPSSISGHGEKTTREELVLRGFSSEFIKLFFEPFFGGVFLERDLTTAATVFKFTFAMFSSGRACLPAGGMSAIPQQMAQKLPSDSLQTRASVVRINHSSHGGGDVVLADGRRFRADSIIVSSAAVANPILLPESVSAEWKPQPWKSARLVAFECAKKPSCGKTLVVSAEPVAVGPIDNLSVPSAVTEGYAPDGKNLIYVSVRSDWEGEDNQLPDAIRKQAEVWFGPDVKLWRHLSTVTVPKALPIETPLARRQRPRSSHLAPGLFLCGDHLTTSSINGALVAGRLAAQEVLESVRP
jgi:phytoene dehydrogenase-like protein